MSNKQRTKTYLYQLWKTKQIRLCSLFLVICSIFTACEPETTCHQELITVAQIILSADSITAFGDTIHYNQWDSIAVLGISNEVGIQGKDLENIGLELRPDTNLTTYLILYHEQIDTLYIQHTPKIQFVNLACGCAVYHTITAAWSSDPRIDSVSIINANIETTAQENLCIYLHE